MEGKPGGPAASTWGTPWPKGAVAADQAFTLVDAAGTAVPVQSWPLAFWPDGSLKWSAHAIAAPSPADGYTLRHGTACVPATPVTVTEHEDHLDVETGLIRARIRRSGPEVISHVWRDDTEVARGVRLVTVRQSGIDDDEEGVIARDRYLSEIQNVVVEQSGPVRAVVRIEGTHASGTRGDSWLPFTLRLYFSAGTESIRMMHTFVVDRHGQDGHIAGLGVRLRVPMRDAAYDRHVRFVGEGHGMMAEAVKGITGLNFTRGPGADVRAAQVAGTALPAPDTWNHRVAEGLGHLPEWGDYTLSQLSANGYTIRKRTEKGYSWIPVDQGGRASGLGYVGGASGGLAFGLRDFWQRHPTQLDIRGAHTEEAEVTVWLWSPEAEPMDLRFYHDGLGQDTHRAQLDGLALTHEDYEPGFGTPYGIARTSELTFWALAATPSGERLVEMADQVRTPPQLINPVGHLVAAKVFGGLFAPVDAGHPVKNEVEEHLDFLFAYYRSQVEERHWYGFWHHGDVMHSFDADRQVWCYDVGGHAWTNSEFSPDLWLWYAFLRSGRADLFRFAEAMTRHTGEVDVYHLGPWAGLGTRHGVTHWGDSCKQHRISNAIYRRIFYYLTADERTGDLLRELVDSERTFLVLDPGRKIRTEPYVPDPAALHIGVCTDWGALAAAWFTEWERNGPQAEAARRKLLAGMESIAALPNGFIQAGARYDLATGRFAAAAPDVFVLHLGAIFGLAEICAELIDAIDMPAFEAAWLQYCRLYNATPAEQAAETGADFGDLICKQGHARLDAYAAARLADDAYAARAWRTFLTPPLPWEYAHDRDWSATKVDNTLNPSSGAPWVYTPFSALFALSAIQCLALIGDKLPARHSTST
ncbi:Tat pathway signal sequence domain protein [Nonomuraea turkmeniaca]|uniref:Tat pathway signal sequence domain protein n=1 Tax=Nonomuraea turkmeniaca TaxID=103838 RepID=A0A5S4EXK0_9ACTN|nr:Tat pathway signal sequence domain protein [Nonomuraea turkmeniaca]